MAVAGQSHNPIVKTPKHGRGLAGARGGGNGVKVDPGSRAAIMRASNAGVAELVDASDSKSDSRKGVGVRFPPPAPLNF